MDKPLQVTFHNLEHSDAVEEEVRARMGKLNELCDRITSGRVVIDSPHRTQERARSFTVRIEIGLPRSEIVVSRDPVPDIQQAVAGAFDVAKKRLRDYVERHNRSS
ncbi:MAG: HPF/RaiA family ribosome-associated protein [Geminicoccaceae bacterium]|nr:ribosome-associated translation inhibitor RaiA [Geminicoccaceae bacterium]